MKNILIVDDSALMRRLISDIITSDKRFEVKDLAIDGLQALDLIVKNYRAYDAVILDINMPRMNGLELLEQLQKNRIKICVIMVSTLTKAGAKETILALERGAFDFVTKPENYLDAKSREFKGRLLEMLCVATKIPYQTVSAAENQATSQILRRTEMKTAIPAKSDLGTASAGKIGVRPPKNLSFASHKKLLGSKAGKSKLVALACSTGGPKSLQSVIPKLPKDLDAPVVLVQHMPKGFTNSLAARLNEMSQVEVKEAADGDILQKGWVYIAPGGKQMRIQKSGTNYKIVTTDEPDRDGLKPCANIMYESLVGSSFDEITCVVLTGMGADGTMGIGALGEKNNIYVISQDEATSVVYGMPRAVAEAKLSDEVQPLEKIADAVTKNVGVLIHGR